MSTVYFVVSRYRSKIDPHLSTKNVLGVFKWFRSARRYLEKLRFHDLDLDSSTIERFYNIE